MGWSGENADPGGSGPLFTKRNDVLVPTFRSHEIVCHNDRVALVFDRHLGSTTVEVSVKFQRDRKRFKPKSHGFEASQDLAIKPARLVNGSPGPCITNVIATCRKNFSQWERSFLWKLRCHWLKFLRRVAKTLVIQGPGLKQNWWFHVYG